MRPDTRIIAAGIGLQVVLLIGFTPARALPPPAPPKHATSPSASPTPVGSVLPYGSTIFFVLDDSVNSGTTQPGTTIHMHLKDPIVVNGVTIAPQGTPASFAVVTTRKASAGDEDGAVQIHLDPLALPGRDAPLPIRAFHEYLTRELTAGQEATRSTTDTLGDIFIPYHVIYHALRPGHQMVLPVGTILRAETAATIDATNPHTIVFSTPPPFTSTYDVPHADLTASPLYTPAPMRPRPLPRGKPTLPPKPAPTTAASAAPDATGSAPAAAASAPAAAASAPAAAAPAPAPSATAPAPVPGGGSAAPASAAPASPAPGTTP